MARDANGLGISASTARLHTSCDVLEAERPQPPSTIAASHCGMQGQTGFLRPYKRPEEGGTGGRRKRRGRRREKGKRCKGEARPFNTYRRYERKIGKGRETEKEPDAAREDQICRDWKPCILKKNRIEGGSVLVRGKWLKEAFKTRAREVALIPGKKILCFFRNEESRDQVRLLLTHVAARLLCLSVPVYCHIVAFVHTHAAIFLCILSMSESNGKPLVFPRGFSRGIRETVQRRRYSCILVLLYPLQ